MRSGGCVQWFLLVVATTACVDDGCELGGGDCEVGSIQSTSMETYEECTGEDCYSARIGTARVRTTWHPGEHALEIDPGSQVLLASRSRNWRTIRLLWLCEPGGRLYVQETELPRHSSGVGRRDTVPLVEWEPDPALWIGGDRAPVLRVEGSAPCWVDDVVMTWRIESCSSPWDPDAALDDAGWSWGLDGGPPDAGPADAAGPDVGGADAGA